MPEIKNNRTKDIERYHQGQMSPAERHALEKAALDDPFLADALEGYSYTSTPEQDLEKITARLQERTRDRKVVPLFFRTTKWLKYAAMFLLVAGGAFLTYKMTAKQDRSLASENRDRDTSTHQSSVMEQKKSDSIPSSSDSTTPAYTFTLTAPTNTHKLNKLSSSDYTVSKKKQAETNNSSTLQGQQQVTISSSLTSQNDDFSKKKTDSSKVVQGTFSTSTPELTLSDKSKFDSKPKGDTIHLHDVVLQPLPNQQLNEVVVVGYGKQRKNTAALKEQIVVDTLEPAQGWTSFNDYIANNIQLPDEIKDKSNAGEVELSFDVDEHGMPTNIAVTKSLCAKCDEEAIRLLKDGPKWKKKRNKKGKVTIHF